MEVTVKGDGITHLTLTPEEREVVRRALGEYSHACRSLQQARELPGAVRDRYGNERHICTEIYERTMLNDDDSGVMDSDLERIHDYL